ncbi:Vacuolar protein sorting-associated protein 18 [Choanephora cucurbitarum]|uniref:Vacuolar protein sorting-associated protein 18 n=1 Tax=Choanephora cucurbitarum TaxID=101091 RepID=A0A1C7NJN4_9FUNG|nr:Vacuolar protein sorting-associated protein 18 [Choanephora cucurbitarum]
MSLFDAFLESTETPVETVEPESKPKLIQKKEIGYAAPSNHLQGNPVFSLQYVQFQLPSKLVSMAVENNIVAVVLDNFRILRIDLENPLQVIAIEIPQKSAKNKVSQLFMDPTARHIVISTANGDNYYLFHTWRKAKELTRLKGIIITSVGWNKYADGNSTHEILIGTLDGLVYETYLEPSDEFFRREERYLHQIYQLESNSKKITGLQFERFPVDRSKYLVMLTTPTRLYHFTGHVHHQSVNEGLFEPIFADYQHNPEFQELPAENEEEPIEMDQRLVLFNRFPELQMTGVPQAFAWLTNGGIYHGSFDFSEKKQLLEHTQLLPFPKTLYDQQTDCLVAEKPLSMVMTEFHFILLYSTHIRALCRLNEKLVFEEQIPLQQDEVVQGMVVDNIKRTYWIYTNDAMYELVIKDEDRDVWRLYLLKGQYGTALHYCKESHQRTQVYTAQAYDDFEQGKYVQSAKYFAKSSVSFEQVVLKFTQKREKDALRLFLISRLERLGPHDKTQKTLIATWLVELYLAKMNRLQEMAASVHFTSTHAARHYYRSSEQFAKDQQDLEDEFHTFLETYGSHLHASTTYRLLSRHGFSSELLNYARMIGDHEKVLEHWSSQKEWDKVIEALNETNQKELMYKFSIPLIENVPERTIDMWINQPELNPRYLIPALLRYSHVNPRSRLSENQAIRYLSYVVSSLKNTDPIIHNFLLTLYATQPTLDETALLTFLKNEGREMHYKLDYALRICSQNQRTQSCVHIYSAMGLYEEAVDLALKHHNLELARINADKPENDDNQALRKRLWVNIAKYVIQDSKDIKIAMDFLKKCDLLKMEDILPFFPDFVLIDDFKDEICSALDEYNIGIEELKIEMDNATSSAEHIRLDVRKFTIVEEDQVCCLCQYPLLTRQFYVFSCHHQYHADCLGNRITKYLPKRLIGRLADIKEQLSHEYDTVHMIQTVEDEKALAARIEHLRTQLDDIIASQCVFCGDIMIESIHLPFYDKTEADSWAI